MTFKALNFYFLSIKCNRPPGSNPKKKLLVIDFRDPFAKTSSKAIN